jgi:hypothetical protein
MSFRLVLPKGPNRVGVTRLKTNTDPVLQIAVLWPFRISYDGKGPQTQWF